MNLLLDTHALIWWWTDNAQLSSTARAAILDERRVVFVSAASAWEIVTKQRLGKLQGVPEAEPRFARLIAADGFVHLGIDHRHALQAGAHAALHRDPFDRMLAAQSEIEGLVLVTRDPAFAAFGIRTLW